MLVPWLTQVACEDAGGQTAEFILGRVLPSQRNGSQMWHEVFSSLVNDELGFDECEPYPCLLRSGKSECLPIANAARGRRPVSQQERLLGVCLVACVEVQV